MEKIVITANSVTTRRMCQTCDSLQFVRLVRDITANGVSQIYWQCQKHNGAIDRPRKNIAHEKITSVGISIDKLPVINNNSELFVCVICGKVGAENHHWAPRYLFGDECDKWPQSNLCRSCHARWHNLVTPDMSKG